MDDEKIVKNLKMFQPSPIDIKGLISPEDVTGVSAIPQGTCKGTLIPAGGVTTGIVLHTDWGENGIRNCNLSILS